MRLRIPNTWSEAHIAWRGAALAATGHGREPGTGYVRPERDSQAIFSEPIKASSWLNQLLLIDRPMRSCCASLAKELPTQETGTRPIIRTRHSSHPPMLNPRSGGRSGPGGRLIGFGIRAETQAVAFLWPRRV